MCNYYCCHSLEKFAMIITATGTFQYLHENTQWVIFADTLRWMILCACFILIGVNMEILGHGWAQFFNIKRSHPMIVLYIAGQQIILITLVVFIWERLGDTWGWTLPLAFLGVMAKLAAVSVMFLADHRIIISEESQNNEAG